MARRSSVGLSEVADRANFFAARHKKARSDVTRFAANLEQELEKIRDEILAGSAAPRPLKRFAIRDPKPRLISAPCFRDRVLHHAIMNVMGPILEASLIDHSYACRTDKGPLAAVRHAQRCARRGGWYAQIDIQGYFPSIRHDLLLDRLRRKFKNAGLLALVARVLAGHEDQPGTGLPIGALTSQHFANFYLSSADRLAQEASSTTGYVRYMDDMIWWCASRDTARAVLAEMRGHIETALGLRLKAPVKLGRSADGMTFCGYRVFADRLLLTRRRKRRYIVFRRDAEAEFVAVRIS
jgi:retron-type reverse transcriptase